MDPSDAWLSDPQWFDIDPALIADVVLNLLDDMEAGEYL